MSWHDFLLSVTTSVLTKKDEEIAKLKTDLEAVKAQLNNSTAKDQETKRLIDGIKNSYPLSPFMVNVYQDVLNKEGITATLDELIATAKKELGGEKVKELEAAAILKARPTGE